MEYWEFLLQQEGDHHWLPLDTAQMEILEGRYRIMAHTSEAHTPVRVQVSQRLLDQDLPKRRSFKRQGQTNADGLMVVIPFTRLPAGTWDIRCSSVPTDTVPSAESSTIDRVPTPDWAYSVQLQVLPPGVGDDEVWTLPPDDAPAAPASIPIAPPVAPRPARPNLDLERTAAALDEAQSDLATGDAIQGWLHRLHLAQTALVGQEGAEVDLTGHMTGRKVGESTAGMALVVRLVDPQTATAVALVPFALESATLPADMHLALTVPPHLETRLLLGELALVQATATTVSVLALQRFTLTVDLASLFDTIANQAEAETDYILDFAGGSGAGQSVAGEPREDAAPSRPLDFPQGPPRSMPVFTLPRDGFNLPPKLYEPSPHEVSARQPTLPPFSTLRRPQPSPPASPDIDPAVSPVPTESVPTAELAPPTGDLPVISAPLPEEPTPRPPTESSGLTDAPPPPEGSRPALRLPPLPAPEPAAPVDKAPTPDPAVPLLPSHEAAGFRDLNLQDRFWSRLNEMAVTLQQESMQRRSTQGTEANRAAAPKATDDAPATPLDPEPFAGEVVIYEDEDETLRGRVSPTAGIERAEGAEGAEDTLAEPIAPPVPDLEVPGGDLIAGESVLLTLRVPFYPNRLYLKVWITDPQTRSLVDEPRQVMNLRPNGHGQLEGTVQVTVPLGCLEAEFESIAVDMITQQESYKATVSRSIVPAGLTPLDPEDLDF